MRPEIQAKVEKIKKVSTILRAICEGMMVLVTLIGLVCVVFVTGGVGGVNYDNIIFRTAELPLGHRLLLGALTAVTWAILFKCFYHLHRLFGNYSRREIFTRESASQLRQFGIACVLWGVMGFLWVLSLAISTRPTQTFQGHSDSIGIGAMIIVIAWLMDIAADLREENELTI